jgi:hypothetical protein
VIRASPDPDAVIGEAGSATRRPLGENTLLVITFTAPVCKA